MSSTGRNRTFFLVDCNNFYVSCERSFDPALEGRPVLILSNNDGCAVALSQEAKKLGIPRGAPLFKWEKVLHSHGGVFLSSNYTLYADMSRRVMEILSSFSPRCEIYSIDEAFLEMDIPHERLEETASRICKTVLHATGIPVSVGIGRTKTLAKAANHYAKKHCQSRGCWIIDEHNREKILEDFPVESVWGIGPEYARLLSMYNIKSAGDFTRINETWVRKKMTVCGLRTQLELKGIPSLSLEDIQPKKAVVSSRSFGTPVSEYGELRESVVSYSSLAAAKIRRQQRAARCITLFLGTNPFKNEPQYANSASCTLGRPSLSSSEIAAYAVSLLDKIFRRGYLYKKSGIMLSGLVPADSLQLDLFEDPQYHRRQERIMKVMDTVNRRYGDKALSIASEGSSNKKWAMRREHLTPCYTTRWSDIPVVKL